MRKIERLLHGGVAAADDRHSLILVEEAVAGGAGRDPAAAKGLFRLHAEIFGGCPGADDQGIAGIDRLVAGEAEGAFAELRLVDMVEDNLGVESFRMQAHALHQVRALYPCVVPGPVVHFGGGHQLAALFHAGYQHGIEIGAGGVDRRGIAGGARTQDQQPAMLGFTHVYLLQLCSTMAESLADRIYRWTWAGASPIGDPHPSLKSGMREYYGIIPLG